MTDNTHSDLTLDALRRLMVDRNARRLYAKFLAPNDNSKNQVYLGGDFSALNILPTGRPEPAGSDEPSQKRLYAGLSFSWILPNGGISPAPGAQLILYPDYPEVRLSGYLRGSESPPSGVMGGTRAPGRVLFLGVTDDGRILGHAVGPESVIARELNVVQESLRRIGVFVQVPLPNVSDPVADRTLLLSELCRISSMGWVASRRLTSSGESAPCGAPNCGGLTLEAELGVRPNALSAPDFHGWEVKQHAVRSFASTASGRITLMTPEPTAGVYAEEGVVEFLGRFGYPDQRGRPDRRNFGGVHRVGAKCARTGLTLTMIGYDATMNVITDPSSGIALLNDAGGSAAEWRYADLLHHWNRKHATAVYVPSMVRRASGTEYRFGSTVRLGTGTDFFLFLRSLALGHVYYNPAIKGERWSTRPLVKRRSQFRIESRWLPDLYHAMESATVCDGAPGLT